MVSDDTLPDGDGFAFLNKVQQDHAQTDRFVVSDVADPKLAVKTSRHAHQIIPKPFDPEVLRDQLNRAFTLGVWLSNPAVPGLIARMTVVPSPPDLYFAVVKALNSPETDFADITRRAQQDPAMTAKLLKVANSAAMGLRHQVTNVGEAISYLGLETTRSLILLTHTFSYCDKGGKNGFSIERLWRHSIATGALARRIAREEKTGGHAMEEAFLAGLLHDIGELLFAVNMPAEYQQVLAEAAGGKQPVWQGEASRFGATHAEVGAELMAIWNLPLRVVEALAFHHQPAQILSAGFSPLTAVHVADVIAAENDADNPEQAALSLDYLDHLGLLNRVEAWREACREELQMTPP